MNEQELTKSGTPFSFLWKWTRFFVGHYKITVLILIAVLFAGLWGLSVNQRQDFPTVEPNYVLVQATYIGATASDLEKEVINPIESSLKGSDLGIKQIRSSSYANAGFLSIELEEIKGAKEKVGKIADNIGSLPLPEKVETKVELAEAMGPTLAYAVYSDKFNKDETLEKAAALKNFLMDASPSLKKIDVMPDPKTKIEVVLKTEELAKNRLNQQQIADALKSWITLLPGGGLETAEGREESIYLEAPIQNLEDLKQVKIGPMKLQDLAEVKRVVAAPMVTFAGFNDGDKSLSRSSVYLLAYKTNKGDIINMVRDLDKKLGEAYDENIIPGEVKVAKVYDNAPQIEDQISSLVQNGFQGLALILVVLMFLASWRAGLVVSLILPLTVLTTLFILPLLGFTFNMLTLFAMILTLGMIVDNAIVITEGVSDHLRQGKSKVAAAILTVKEFGPAVTVATLTTVVAFIPFLFIGGIMGEIMKYIPYTVIIMLLVSYFLSLTITPLFARWILKSKNPESKPPAAIAGWKKYLLLPWILSCTGRFIDRLVEKYGRMMTKILAKRSSRLGLIFASLILFIIVVVFVGPSLKFQQFPDADTEVATVSLEYPAGTPLAVKEQISQKVGEEIVKTKYFTSYFLFENQITVFFKKSRERQDKEKIDVLMADLSKRLDEVKKTFPSDVLVEAKKSSYGPPADKYDFTIEFVAENDDGRKKAVTDLENFVREKNISERIFQSEKDELVPSVKVSLDKNKIANFQLNPFMISAVLNGSFSETEVGRLTLKNGGTSEKVVLTLPKDKQRSVSDVKDLVLINQGPAKIRLAEAGLVEETKKLESINHLDGDRVSSFKVKLKTGEDKTTFEKQIKDYLSADKMKSYGLRENNVTYGGQVYTSAEDFKNLQAVFVLAMIAVFLIIVYEFRSYVKPLLIMVSVPLAFIGVLPALKLVGGSIDMISGLGLVAVVGIVVNEAIVFIDCLLLFRRNQPRIALAAALVEVGKGRIRPIFSTALTTVFGILPITIADPFWVGLGTSIISGLIFSTLGTLIVIPVLIYAFSGKKEKSGEKLA